MEFSDSLNFLCVIEEERENGDGDSFVDETNESELNYLDVTKINTSFYQEGKVPEALTSSYELIENEIFDPTKCENSQSELDSEINHQDVVNKNRKDDDVDMLMILFERRDEHNESEQKDEQQHCTYSTYEKSEISFMNDNDILHTIEFNGNECPDGGNSVLEKSTNDSDELFEAILEAPAEFNNFASISGKTGENFTPQVPQPLREPEKDPPHRDIDNINSTETGDTIQRPLQLQHDQTNDDDGNDEIIAKCNNTKSGSTFVEAATTFAHIDNCPENNKDNGHVELEGDSRNVNAFIHVGTRVNNDAPIQHQQHDMLLLSSVQIESNERELNVEISEMTSEISENNQSPNSGCIDFAQIFSSHSALSGGINGNSEYFHWSSSPYQIICNNINTVLHSKDDGNYEKVSSGFDSGCDMTISSEFSETSVLHKQDDNNNLENLDGNFGQFNKNKTCVLEDDLVVTYPTSPEELNNSAAEHDHSLCAHLNNNVVGDVDESSITPLSSLIHAESDAPAPAPGRSSTETTLSRGCVGLSQAPQPGCTSCDPGCLSSFESKESREVPFLKWSFKNGRLVFDNGGAENSDDNEVTSSSLPKDINENNSNSRLKFLETKLKKAGIVDEENLVDFDDEEQVVDKSKSAEGKKQKAGNYVLNQHQLEVDVNERDEDERNHEEFYYVDPEGLTNNSQEGGSSNEEFCQFDVRQPFPSTIFNGHCLVYDELTEEEYPHEINFNPVAMGTDSDRSQDRPKHNPDTDNLKSLLKRPGGGGGYRSSKKNNRVVFNENKNEFFDADYIILIREECDYDDEDDDSVCTCSQHEMVRLTCCEPNCNCEIYDAVPQSPKFAPPLEFVDAVTLSPPEGYKDMELEEQELFNLHQMVRSGQQRRAVCRECSATHEDDDEAVDGSLSDEGECQQSDMEETEEREKTDQSQQTTPTTPDKNTVVEFSSDDSASRDSISNYVRAEEIHPFDMDERDDRMPSYNNVPAGGSPISGILKGGKLWKQTSLDTTGGNSQDLQQFTDSSLTSDEENGSKRSVRFIESDDQRGGCDGASDDSKKDEELNLLKERITSSNDHLKPTQELNNLISPESTEMMLTFKIGNHVLISNNSLKPNSAVRQLFPCTNANPTTTTAGKDEAGQQYLVTSESLRAFEEAKHSKLTQIGGDPDESIKRAIERNTLRRSLIRYEPRVKKAPKSDNSLVERIKQLTCDVDNDEVREENRASPTGEETITPATVEKRQQQIQQTIDKNSFSPSSSSTGSSSNSSSVSTTYKKLTDLFTKKERTDPQNNLVNTSTNALPDLGNGPHELQHHQSVSRLNAGACVNNENRKQFLPSLAPLTSCVSGVGSGDDYYYPGNNQAMHVGERASLASSVGTEYSLEDIDEALKNDHHEESKRITPDVLAGTPSASESGDELAMFVQQDAGRIERIKKKYQPEDNAEEDDEHNDYGFNKRPSVRGIKPRFGTTTQIIQQIQNQMQPSMEAIARVSWPYYSENVDNSKTKNLNISSYQNLQIDSKKPPPYPPNNPVYRPTSLSEENMYHSGQYCTKQVYRINGNPGSYPTVMKFGRCNEVYQSLPRQKSNGRPLSPPPLEMSRTYHQTMVYIPYNTLERASPNMYQYKQQQQQQSGDYARISNQNQINSRYVEPIYQQRFHMHVEDHVMTSNAPRPMIRIPYHPPPPPGVKPRSESPQYSTARSTQTPFPNCNYYNPRYRPVVMPPNWQNEPTYVTKMNRHSFPNKYSSSDTSTGTDTDCSIQNGYRQSIEISFSTKTDVLSSTSPTKPKFMERGVPEGAASVSPPDPSGKTTEPQNVSSPQNTMLQQPKPMFYAMNV